MIKFNNPYHIARERCKNVFSGAKRVVQSTCSTVRAKVNKINPANKQERTNFEYEDILDNMIPTGINPITHQRKMVPSTFFDCLM